MHKKRTEIDRALLGGTSMRDVAGQHRLTKSAVQRHKEHLPQAAIAERVEADERRGQSLADMWLDLRTRALKIADAAEKTKDRKTELAAIRELTRLADLGLKASEQLTRNQSASAELHEHKDWPALVGVLLDTLHAHPDAYAAVREALTNLATTRGQAT